MTNQKRILIVVNDLAFFYSHRLPIAHAAQQAGYEVHVAYGTQGKTEEKALTAKGISMHFVHIQRGGTNPFTDIRSGFLLGRLFCRLKPHIVHLVTIKPVLYGGIAARLVRVPAVVSAMTGLGFLFVAQNGIKAAVLRRIIRPLFKLALGHKNQRLIFQNQHDRDQVLCMAPIPPQQVRLIRGAGIDLANCPVVQEPEGIPVIAMAARLLRDKGVKEFIEAARILRSRAIRARFWLIGAPDPANPTSVSTAEVAAWKTEGVVECLGYRTDVLSLYAQANVVTLPSYGEGLPKSLIEAAACARAVVTTDIPGCRDAIEPDVTGVLVPARNAVSLADAIERLIKNPALRQSMGKAARVLAEREFGIEKVVATHLQLYQELLSLCVSR